MANTVLYGFHNLQSIKNERVTDSTIPVIGDAVQQAVDFHNEETDATQALLAEPTTRHSERFKVATAARLQPVDETGRARPIQTRGYFDVAYPIKEGAIAEGDTYIASVLKTVGDVEQTTATMLIADANWMTDQLLAAAYNNADWTYEDDLEGPLVVKPIANGDSQTYFTVSGASTGTTQTNTLAQVDDIDDTHNALDTGARQLRKFPGQNGQSVQIVSLVPTNLINDVMNLAGFMDEPDDNVQTGANTDVLRRGPGVRTPGILRGYDKVSRTWVVEWDRMVDDYIIQVVASGPRPLARREYDDARLRGFNMIGQRNDVPYYERQYRRYAGFGARNRTAMVVTRIGNASYAIPTNYNPATMG